MSFCKWPQGCENYCEGNTDYCGTHNHMLRKQEREALKEKKQYVIPKVSEKRKKLIPQYSKQKQEFIKGKVCPVYPMEPIADIHHKKGREGYADQWARDNGITLLMDVRFWLAVSRKGHDWIENNPEKAKMMGYSMERNEILK